MLPLANRYERHRFPITFVLEGECVPQMKSQEAG